MYTIHTIYTLRKASTNKLISTAEHNKMVGQAKLLTGGPSSGAWGMYLQLPLPSKHQPWYTHCRRPDGSMRPSESGANRWGQRSSNTCHRPFVRSHHTTRSSPITVFACGRRLSRSQMGATGYQWANQSNFSPSPVASGSASVTTAAAEEEAEAWQWSLAFLIEEERRSTEYWNDGERGDGKERGVLDGRECGARRELRAAMRRWVRKGHRGKREVLKEEHDGAWSEHVVL